MMNWGGMQDSIFIKNIPVKTFIGVYAFEQHLLQTLKISLQLFTDTRRAAQTDDLNDALDYAAISEFVASFAATHRFALIERLAAELIAALFAAYPTIEAIKIKVKKPGAITYTQSVGVCIYRTRED